MEEILHQLLGSLSTFISLCTGFYTSKRWCRILSINSIVNSCFWFQKIVGRWYIITQLAVYTTYIPHILPIGGLYITYHLLREPETAVDYTSWPRVKSSDLQDWALLITCPRHAGPWFGNYILLICTGLPSTNFQNEQKSPQLIIYVFSFFFQCVFTFEICKSMVFDSWPWGDGPTLVLVRCRDEVRNASYISVRRVKPGTSEAATGFFRYVCTTHSLWFIEFNI